MWKIIRCLISGRFISRSGVESRPSHLDQQMYSICIVGKIDEGDGRTMGERKACIVIGAGISGLLLARRLTCAGHQVQVLDKGRGIGGRMMTRRFGGGRIDHGAQFFTARGHHMRELVRDLENSRVLRVWSQGFLNEDGTLHQDGYPRYMAANGMSDIPKYLATGLDVRTSARVAAITRNSDHWKLAGDDGEVWVCQSLVITAPAEQALEMLTRGGTTLTDRERSLLGSVQYHPCYAAMIRLDGPSRIPSPGGMALENHDLRWIADNRIKGLPHGDETSTLVTVHASPEFTRTHWDVDPESVGRKIVSLATPWLGSEVVEVQVHRWKYSQALQKLDPPYLMLEGDPTGLIAGDGFGGGKVEGAVESAAEAAQAILSEAHRNSNE